MGCVALGDVHFFHTRFTQHTHNTGNAVTTLCLAAFGGVNFSRVRGAAFNSSFDIFMRQAVTRADDHSDRPVLKVACILHIGTMRIIRNSLKRGIALNLIKNMLQAGSPHAVTGLTIGKNEGAVTYASVLRGRNGFAGAVAMDWEQNIVSQIEEKSIHKIKKGNGKAHIKCFNERNF